MQVPVLHGRSERDERLVKLVGDGVHALVHGHLGAAGHALDLLDISLDGHDRYSVRRVDVVPDAEVGAALCDDDVAVRHPLYVARE